MLCKFTTKVFTDENAEHAEKYIVLVLAKFLKLSDLCELCGEK
jgi:hypothetical protein